MNKKLVAALTGLSLVISLPVMAFEPTTLSDRVDRLDEVVYGDPQSGSILSRVDSVDNMIYGNGYTSGTGLDERVNNLYTDVVRNDNDATPSISTRTNALEYYLTDEVKQGGIAQRIADLETSVYGSEQKGALDQRMANLEKSVYGDQHYEMRSVTLPANTVFKIAINDDVSSKTNQVGDPVNFTVQQDVLVDNVLVLPRGAQGSGVITKVSRPQMFGRSGSIDISFDQVFSVDDEEIPTVLGPESKDKLKMEAAAVGASTIGALALGPIGLVGGLFVKGKDVEMPAGSELYIQTKSDVSTKGLVLENGAPNTVLRHRVHRTAAMDAEDAEQAEQEGLFTDDSAADTSSDSSVSSDTNAKEELDSVKNKDTGASEDTSGTDASSEEEPASVVIVRNDQ